MIPVTITTDMIDRATILAEKLGKLNNSILSGKGNFAGFLGQEMFLKQFGGVPANDYDFDIVYNGKRIEIKTKNTTVTPRDYYMCSVAAYNTAQDSDYYAFCRVKVSDNIGWICGFYPKNKYFIDATFLKQGDYDPDNDYYVRADCWNLPISKLYEEIL
jgi:hypothetical protein